MNSKMQHIKSFGKYSYHLSSINIYNFGNEQENYTLSVGNYTSIADRCVVLLSNGHHYQNTVSQFPFNYTPDFKQHSNPEFNINYKSGDVIIGNDVWIGLNVTILPNVKIGDGAVIAAGSIVTKDVPPYAFVAGNPATIKKYRFNDEIINNLLQIKWWDWPVEVIKKELFTIQSYPNDIVIKKLWEIKNNL